MSKRILVIEDDLMLLKSIGVALRKQGYAVHEARNGKEAVQALEKQGYDLVLADLMLPYANGFELLAKIRNDDRHNGTPVLIVSAVSNEETLLESFSIGADDYLRKPFVPGELISRVSRLLLPEIS